MSGGLPVRGAVRARVEAASIAGDGAIVDRARVRDGTPARPRPANAA